MSHSTLIQMLIGIAIVVAAAFAPAGKRGEVMILLVGAAALLYAAYQYAFGRAAQRELVRQKFRLIPKAALFHVLIALATLSGLMTAAFTVAKLPAYAAAFALQGFCSWLLARWIAQKYFSGASSLEILGGRLPTPLRILEAMAELGAKDDAARRGEKQATRVPTVTGGPTQDGPRVPTVTGGPVMQGPIVGQPTRGRGRKWGQQSHRSG